MNHREACYELRQSADRLQRGDIDRNEWYQQVSATITARQRQINEEMMAFARGQAATALRQARNANGPQTEPAGTHA
jgi:hypothetical protein